MIRNYKDALYDSYVSTHLNHRKGPVTVGALRQQARAFKQHFGRFLPHDRLAKIGDLGCGSGNLVWWLSQCGYSNVCGVDTSAEQVAVAQALGVPNVVHGDVFAFLEANRGFHVLFARDLVEHFDKQAAFDFLLSCRAALCDHGTLILQVPNAESPFFGRVRYGDFTHELAFTRSSVTQILSAAGFDAIRVLPWRPAVTGVRSAIRYLIWRIVEPMLKLPIMVESAGPARIVTMNLIAAARRTAE